LLSVHSNFSSQPQLLFQGQVVFTYLTQNLAPCVRELTAHARICSQVALQSYFGAVLPTGRNFGCLQSLRKISVWPDKFSAKNWSDFPKKKGSTNFASELEHLKLRFATSTSASYLLIFLIFLSFYN
jgi:hypothetical protein